MKDNQIKQSLERIVDKYQPAQGYICPTKAISIEDVDDTRKITMPHGTMEFKLKKCNTCGRYWVPERQLDYIIKKVDLPADAFDNCPDCRD